MSETCFFSFGRAALGWGAGLGCGWGWVAGLGWPGRGLGWGGLGWGGLGGAGLVGFVGRDWRGLKGGHTNLMNIRN